MNEDATWAAINAVQLTPADERLIAFGVLHLCGDNAALIQAVTAWGALVRADERERIREGVRNMRLVKPKKGDPYDSGWNDGMESLLSALRA